MPAHMPAQCSPYVKSVVSYHATIVTILWVSVLFLSVGFGLTMLQMAIRLDVLENQAIASNTQISEMSALLATVQRQASQMNTLPTKTGTPTSTAVTAPTASPSGVLQRGNLSPDGTKYAGYDTTTKGKMGIGVEVLGDPRIRHIVIFNPLTESFGNGTPSDALMSVRWKDNKTIEYDVLVKTNGQWVKQTQTTEIYF